MDDPQPQDGPPPVTILLAVYNGAAHLQAQLDSLVAQDHPAWSVLASDDGSRDDSVALLDRFARSHPLRRIAGPGAGVTRNFMGLLGALPAAPGLVALCDQDDIWLPDKLGAAVAALAAVPPQTPALYCGRRMIWHPERSPRSQAQPLSLHYRRAPGFANALIENIAAGNTIVLNPAAAAVARAAADTAHEVYAHDWWLYQLISGVGGTVIYDPEPRLLYRQHGGNVIGAGETPARALRNKLGVLRGVYAHRMGQQLHALTAVAPLLTPDNRARLHALVAARRAPLTRRLALLRRAGVYRQGALSDLMFRMAACLARI